ncbi:MAG: alpha/beta fold hydrolase [Pseudomonadota bacterium]
MTTAASNSGLDLLPELSYQPPRLLRSPHVQTVLSSRIVKNLGKHKAAADIPGTETLILPASLTNGPERLLACVDRSPIDAPLMILIHGWLGAADSPYMARSAAAFQDAGYRVARLLLRDHGGSAHLNEDMFHSGRIDEVVAACNELCARFGAHGAGLMGYSLGGNFTLRALAHPQLSTALAAGLAVCPVIDPAPAAVQLDAGWAGYSWWFVKKWHRAMREKELAFPARYRFSDPQQSLFAERSVVRLTERFVEDHTPYASADEYYQSYTITDATLNEIARPTMILAAVDDPVVAVEPIQLLTPPPAVGIRVENYGGHCAFLDSYRLSSFVSPFSTAFFNREIRSDRKSAPRASHSSTNAADSLLSAP